MIENELRVNQQLFIGAFYSCFFLPKANLIQIPAPSKTPISTAIGNSIPKNRGYLLREARISRPRNWCSFLPKVTEHVAWLLSKERAVPSGGLVLVVDHGVFG